MASRLSLRSQSSGNYTGAIVSTIGAANAADMLAMHDSVSLGAIWVLVACVALVVCALHYLGLIDRGN